MVGRDQKVSIVFLYTVKTSTRANILKLQCPQLGLGPLIFSPSLHNGMESGCLDSRRLCLAVGFLSNPPHNLWTPLNPLVRAASCVSKPW